MLHAIDPTSAIDDPHKVVRVIASDGKTGETRELSYTNCKVIGNGSFGVVFQAKLLGAPKDQEEIAIKKVLQDKRFKVGLMFRIFVLAPHVTQPRYRVPLTRPEPRVANHETRVPPKRRRS